MHWGRNLILAIHLLPDSCGAVNAPRYRNMKLLSAQAHRNTLHDRVLLSNSFFLKPRSSWKNLNSDRGQPKSHISLIGSSSIGHISESHALQRRNSQTLYSKGCLRDLNALKPSVGLSRVLVWTSAADRGFHEHSLSGYVASIKGDCEYDSTSPSSSLRQENVLNDDEEGDSEDIVDYSEEEVQLEGGEMELAEDVHKLWDLRPKNKGDLKAGLYLVGTPIGNLEDITLRALRILQSATCILAEDTRHSSKLLQHYGISTPTMSYHKFNEHARRNELILRLQRGEVLALISDAGMPGISDPGSELVKACVEENVKVFPIPGPSAALTALVASGLPTEEFSFVGFLSAQASARRKRLLAAAKESATQIFYVPPHKLCRVLDDFISTFGASRIAVWDGRSLLLSNMQCRRCVIAREITKIHEEFWRSTLEEAKAEFGVRQPRGELTLIIEGLPEGAGVEEVTKEELISRLKIFMEAGKGPSEASKLVVEETSARRNTVYSLALEINRRSK